MDGCTHSGKACCYTADSGCSRGQWLLFRQHDTAPSFVLPFPPGSNPQTCTGKSEKKFIASYGLQVIEEITIAFANWATFPGQRMHRGKNNKGTPAIDFSETIFIVVSNGSCEQSNTIGSRYGIGFRCQKTFPPLPSFVLSQPADGFAEKMNYCCYS